MANILDFINSMLPKAKTGVPSSVSTLSGQTPIEDNFAQSTIKGLTKNIPVVGDYINKGFQAPKVSQTPGFVDGQFTSDSPAMNQTMQDVSDLGQGVVNMPRNVLLHPVETAKGAVTGPISSVANTVGAILGDKKSKDQFTQHPISDTVGTVGTLMGVEKGVENLKPGTGQIAKAPKTTLPEITGRNVNGVSQEAINNYKSIFEVNKAYAKSHNIDKTISQVIKDGNTNISNIDDLRAVADSVTGENGGITKINQHILGDIKTPVDYSVAKPAEFSTVPNANAVKINDYMAGYPKGFTNTLKANIEKAYPQYDMDANNVNVTRDMYGNVGKYSISNSGMPQNQALPADLFKTSQKLGALERMYHDQARSPGSDGIINPQAEQASLLLKDLKNNVNDVLDSAVDKNNFQGYKTDPRIQAELARMPKGVADRWINETKDFGQSRSVAAPYVELSKLVDETDFNANAPLSKLRDTVQPSAAIAHNMTHPVEFAKNLGESALQKVTGAFTDKTPEQLTQQLTSGVAGAPAAAGSALGEALGGIKNAAGAVMNQAAQPLNAIMHPAQAVQNAASIQGAGVVGGAMAGQEAQNKEVGQNINMPPMPNLQLPVTGTDQPQSTVQQPPQYTTVQQLPKTMAEIKPDASGNFQVASPFTLQGGDGNSLALSEDAYQSQRSQLSQQLGDAKLNNPQMANQIQSQMDSLDSKMKTSTRLGEAFNAADDLNSKMVDARAVLAKAPINLLTLFPTYDKLMSSGNEDYKKLAQDLRYIEKNYPDSAGTLLTPSTSDVALSKIDTVNKLLLDQWHKTLSRYTGGTTQTGAAPSVQSQLPNPQSRTQAVPQNINFSGGSLPPIQ